MKKKPKKRIKNYEPKLAINKTVAEILGQPDIKKPKKKSAKKK